MSDYSFAFCKAIFYVNGQKHEKELDASEKIAQHYGVKRITLDLGEIYYGAHADDAAGNAYPDTSVAFHHAISDAIYLGSGNALKIVAPFIDKSKAQVVSTGVEIGVPFELAWSCYEGHDKACG